MTFIRRKRFIWWIGVTLGVAIALTVLFGKPLYLFIHALVRDKPVVEGLPPGYIDDASRMNRTRVAEVRSIPADPAAAESQLRDLINFARSKRLRVAIAGARHSMGGHTIYPDGIVLDMLPFNRMELNAETQTLRVGAGARWSEIVPYLDSLGYSVAIMQSNNNFSVGGSLSVNCHGWQHNQPPISSTVKSFRLMKADGAIVRCSRSENTELFSLALGGYGLFGVILDVELQVTPNERYLPEVEVLASDKYVARFVEKVDGNPAAGMVYGRLCVVPGEETFLREAILTVFHRSPCKREEIPLLRDAGFTALRRGIYRAQIGSDAGKKLRWRAEKRLGEQFFGKFFSRNQLLNEGAEVYQEQSPERTDILHEYFIPPAQFTQFLERVRSIVPKHRGDLLNVTVRNVKQDNDAFLRYADQDMFAFVMLFNQARTQEDDKRMEEMTQELIDAALACGGRYYLPYRLHATKAQFEKAYPRAPAWFERKRHYDPEEIFQNQFYTKYGRP
jgi:FAD/FMN-containing dehydrogenase